MKKIAMIMMALAIGTAGYATGKVKEDNPSRKDIHAAGSAIAVRDSMPVTYYKDRQGIPVMLPHSTNNYPPLPANPVRPNNPPYPAPGNPSNPANPVYPNQQHTPAYPSTPATPLYPNNPTLPVVPVSPASPMSFPASIPLAPVMPL